MVIVCCVAAAGGFVTSVAPAAVRAEHAGAAAEQAAQEIQDARDRANASAQAMFDTESRIDTLDLEIADTNERVEDLQAEVASLHAALQTRALQRFTQGPTLGNPLLTPIGEMNTAAIADVYAGVATGTAVASADELEAAVSDLDELRADLAHQLDKATQARSTFEALKAQAEADVVELSKVEQQRLADANVQHELDRLRRARQEQEARQAAEEAAQAPAQQPAGGGSSGSTNSGSTSSGDDRPGTTNPPHAAAPPPPSPPPGGMTCPVAGPTGFADTWGAPRSGGRSHQGVDMISPAGTPLAAASSGFAQFSTNRLGGNAVWLNADDGTRYYYAHLSAWEGSSRPVAAGEIIGYVGATGNTTVNHLHFEVHPGGGNAVNPYPYVARAC